MSYETKYPLSIIEVGGDTGETGFVKVKNEFTWLYGLLSFLFSPTTGHKHTGAVNDSPQIGTTGIEDAAITPEKLANGGLSAWTVSGRPATPITGQIGYNTDLAVIERYNGSAWIRVSGGRRGDIKIWSGALNDIETGWVLADGVERAHPEGGNYTPPDLRYHFLVGAGTSNGSVRSVSINSGGTGYAVNNVIQVTAGNSNCRLKVTSVASGVVKSVSIIAIGSGYSVISARATTNISGSGTGCTINIDVLEAYSVGETGGETNHVLTINEIPIHNHPKEMHFTAYLQHDGSDEGDRSIVPNTSGTTTGNTGGGLSHENRPLYYAACFLYKI